MNHSHQDDLRRLVMRQLDGIHPSRVGRAVAYAMLALAAAIVTAAGIDLCMRSGNEILGRLTPGWPWW